MAVAYSARAYQDTTADTADQNQTLVLLFEGAVRFLARALQAMRRKDYEGQCEGIVRAQRIFSTLMCSLDRAAAPELAAGLWSTYEWIHASLTEASLHDDEELLEQVLEVVSDLCEAWRQARRNLSQ
jgi:flagellar secretion chaperone FliS